MVVPDAPVGPPEREMYHRTAFCYVETNKTTGAMRELQNERTYDWHRIA